MNLNKIAMEIAFNALGAMDVFNKWTLVSSTAMSLMVRIIAIIHVETALKEVNVRENARIAENVVSAGKLDEEFDEYFETCGI